MIIQAIKYGEPPPQEFAFTYSGDYTDNRVDGVGTVRLNTSGTLEVTSGTATVSAYILAGGGGAVCNNWLQGSTGGGGGNQTFNVELSVGTYEIVIGTGGAGITNSFGSGANGGNTIAFGKTSTGGGGGVATTTTHAAGTGGTPNGGAGTAFDAYTTVTKTGGSPNGGGVVSRVAQAGGDGYVEFTFS